MGFSIKKKQQCFLAVILVAVLILGGCKVLMKNAKANDIIILYTNDVHCAVDGDIGYAGLAAYKKRCEQNTPYVTLVDCGDAIQGELLGTVSKGEYIIDLMNVTGYDYAVLGNHEFDYGMEQLGYLMDSADFCYLGCNINYTGHGENPIAALKPYALEKYGKITVAFIGVSTPYSITTSTPKYFMDESGNLVYDFCNSSAKDFYECVQNYVDESIKAGADYVILLSHLGDGEEFSPYSSTQLIANTKNVDVVLDGHARSTISSDIVKNQEGKDVLLSSTGTGLANIGQLVITKNGMISTGLISSYENKDDQTEEFVLNVKSTYEDEIKEVLAVSDTPLSCGDENEMFVEVTGDYRVSNVEVLNADNSYSPLNLEKTYTVASTDYIIKDYGDGYNMFADNTLLIDEGMTDYQMLANYIQENLGGNLSAYSSTQGRIQVK